MEEKFIRGKTTIKTISNETFSWWNLGYLIFKEKEGIDINI